MTESFFGRVAEDQDDAMAWVARLDQAEALVANLRAALESRELIGQATGLVMARLGCDETQAFATLRTQSQNDHVKLRAVAADVVANHDAVHDPDHDTHHDAGRRIPPMRPRSRGARLCSADGAGPEQAGPDQRR